MLAAGKCSRCGDIVEEGEFCYRLEEEYICRRCMNAAAVIAGPEIRCREREELPVLREKRTGAYIGREIDVAKYLEKRPVSHKSTAGWCGKGRG